MFGHVSTERVSRGPDLSQGARLVAHPPCPQHHDQNLKTGPNCVARMIKRWLCNAVRHATSVGTTQSAQPALSDRGTAAWSLHPLPSTHLDAITACLTRIKCVDLQKCYRSSWARLFRGAVSRGSPARGTNARRELRSSTEENCAWNVGQARRDWARRACTLPCWQPSGTCHHEARQSSA